PDDIGPAFDLLVEPLLRPDYAVTTLSRQLSTQAPTPVHTVGADCRTAGPPGPGAKRSFGSWTLPTSFRPSGSPAALPAQNAFVGTSRPTSFAGGCSTATTNFCPTGLHWQAGSTSSRRTRRFISA